MHLKFNQIALAGMLTCLSASALASTYFFVQPKAFGMSTVAPFSVTLASQVLPSAVTNLVYNVGGFNLAGLATVTGDPALNQSLVTFSVTAGALPDGISLSSAGLLSGTTSTVGENTIQVTATYKNATSAKNYTFNVTAPVIPVGQVAFTTKGTYSFVAPPGVTSVSVVAVGGGEFRQYAGDGSALAWKNNIAVVPGQAYVVVVGAAAANFNYSPSIGPSYFINSTTVMARVGSYVGDGGGLGGIGAKGFNGGCGTGGGAGGYTGAGGDGAALTTSSTTTVQATAGQGGGGGGGATSSYNSGGLYGCGGGGGVGIYGQGADGAADVIAVDSVSGGGGSGGANGYYKTISAAGTYGGGGATFSSGYYGAGGGAVRIIWGPGRAFPSTLTADQ